MVYRIGEIPRRNLNKIQVCPLRIFRPGQGSIKQRQKIGHFHKSPSRKSPVQRLLEASFHRPLAETDFRGINDSLFGLAKVAVEGCES